MYLTSLFLLITAQTREFPTVLITTRTNITVVMAASADSAISSVSAPDKRPLKRSKHRNKLTGKALVYVFITLFERLNAEKREPRNVCLAFIIHKGGTYKPS